MHQPAQSGAAFTAESVARDSLNREVCDYRKYARSMPLVCHTEPDFAP